jgi:hypothetical protein
VEQRKCGCGKTFHAQSWSIRYECLKCIGNKRGVTAAIRESEKTPRPSPWFKATGPKCRVTSPQGMGLGSAVACVTPNGESVRVGTVIGKDDRETSVVLSRAQARAYAESILAMCAEPAPPVSGDQLDRLAALYGVTRQRPAGLTDDEMRDEFMRALGLVCPAGDCPCGRVRAGCEYHDPTLQPR